jgi:hypothetical protein
MGNVCASHRNKECFYVAKNPKEVIGQFSDCLIYTKKHDTKKSLKRKRKSYLRKVDFIDQQLSDGDY